MTEHSLKARTLQSSMWTLGGFGASRVMRLANHLILAWLLTPQIFGLMALVKVFMQGMGMFSDIGIGPSIIQSKRGNDPVFFNTAWTVQLIRGVSLWIITCLLAWPFAWWYAKSDPLSWQLFHLLPVSGFVTVIQGCNSTALFTLTKELRLGKLTLLELGSQVVSLSVMIIWALVHPTVWAMVAGGLAGSLTRMVVSHFIVPGHRVRLQWDHDCYKELFKFGRWIFLSTMFTFLALNLDKLTLGKLLTLTDLGLYGIALVFTKAALDVASRLGSAVMFPVYSKYQDQPSRLMELALKARHIVLWVGAAVCICFGTAAPLFFETFWDPRYHEAGIIARWLGLYMWMRIMLQSMDRIPLAMGNSRVLFYSNVIQTGGILAAASGYWIGDLTGFIVGLAFGPAAAHLFLLNHIPPNKGKMLRQSAIFTILAGITGVAFVAMTIWLRNVVSYHVWIATVLFLSLSPLTIAGWISYRRIGWQFPGLRTKQRTIVPQKADVS